MGTNQTISYSVPSSYQIPILTQRYEILDYLHVGEDDYLSLSKDARENDYPILKRPLIKYESINVNILYPLVDINYSKCGGKMQYITKCTNEVRYTIVLHVRTYGPFET